MNPITRAITRLDRRLFGAGPFTGTDGHGSQVVQFTPGAVEAIRLFGDGSSLSALYRRQWAVRTCVNYLALNIAHLNLKVYRKLSETEHDPAQDSPLAALLNDPNPNTDRFSLIRGTVSDLAIYDNAFWLKQFINNARRIYRIPPEYVTVVGGDIVRGPQYYLIDSNGGGGAQRFAPTEIVHIHGYNAIDTRVGSSPLESLRNVLAEEIAASQHREFYYRNSARREGLIERPLEAPVLDEPGLKRLQEAWAGNTAGTLNAGRTAVLEEGGHWVETSWSPKDSEFIPGRQFTLDTVATQYNIPLALLSRSQTPTFASLKEFHNVLYVDVLGPWNAMIEQALMRQLVPDFNDPLLFVEFNIEEKMQGDFETTANALRSHVQVPDMSVNDSRRIQNQAPYGDPNDDTNPFNFPARPSNYAYEGDPAPPAPGPTPQNVVPMQQNAAMNGHAEDLAALLADLDQS